MTLSYKLLAEIDPSKPSRAALRSDGVSFVFDPENRDYEVFMAEWKAGATVTNADGTPAPYTPPGA